MIDAMAAGIAIAHLLNLSAKFKERSAVMFIIQTARLRELLALHR